MDDAQNHFIRSPLFSPQKDTLPEGNIEHPLKSSINLLDSLIAFYQHERMWVYRTRATLDDGFPTPLIDNYMNWDKRSRFHGSNDSESPANQQQQSTRWARRKKGYKLRINNIRARRIINICQRDDKEIPAREQLLERFEKMMEARIESCQRVNKLVREANRADLHNQ